MTVLRRYYYTDHYHWCEFLKVFNETHLDGEICQQVSSEVFAGRTAFG